MIDILNCLTLKLFCTIKCHKNFSICQLFTSHGKYFRQLKSKYYFITSIEVLVECFIF